MIWNEREMPIRAIRCGFIPVMSRPSKTMRPPSGAWWPVSTWKQVVLPAPFGPMMPWTAALLEGERDVLQHDPRAEPLVEVLGGEERHHASSGFGARAARAACAAAR